MQDHANDKRSPIIGGALILTVGFLALFVALFSAGKFPDGCTSGLWLIDRLRCLEPNALGDTFAGAFAPVAFVWLVAAVMLQRNELTAQRQELRESRGVAAQQVEEAKRNAEFIGQQTALLEDRRLAEIAEESDVRLERLAEMLSEKIEELRTQAIVEVPTENLRPHQGNPKRLFVSVTPGQKPFACIGEFGRLVQPSIYRFERAYGAENKVVRIAPEKIVVIANLARRAEEVSEKASASMKDRLAYVGWGNLKPAIVQLVEYIEKTDGMWESAYAEEMLEEEIPN